MASLLLSIFTLRCVDHLMADGHDTVTLIVYLVVRLLNGRKTMMLLL